MLYTFAVFAPLVGALIAGLLGPAIGDRAAELAAILGMVVSAVCGVVVMGHVAFDGAAPASVPIFDWVQSGSLHVHWALRYDTLSAVMVGMVSFVSMLIHIYTVGYMAHEPDGSRYRFMGYISLFTFAMLMLATSDNLLQLFFGWEGVGFCSYLLIGYWFERDYANDAAIKAFVVNRIGDLCFALGIALIYLTFGTLDFQSIFAALPQHAGESFHLFGSALPTYEVIATLLFIGAMGKSAQIFLHTWLPDAMAGPTPISALIHAATMVTAGVFLMARMGPLLNDAPNTLAFVTLIGGATTVFAATIGMVQFDIKKIIAYSTCSELGFMMVGIGSGVYQTAIFLLVCHAFFKALLFLCAGAVITQQHEEQDVRNMGGLWRKMPITCATFWIGSLSLGGMWPFAGAQSHDAVLHAAYAAGRGLGAYGYFAGVIATYLTCIYIFRELYLVFHGRPRMPADRYKHSHEAPLVMTGPLIVLAIGAAILGVLLAPWFVGEDWHEFWRDSIQVASWNHAVEGMESLPAWAGSLPLGATLAGMATVLLCYVLAPGIPAWLATTFRPIYLFFLNKWYFDELYRVLFVRPYLALARQLWQVGDVRVIDGVPNELAALTNAGSARAVRLQTGSMALYAFMMLIGLLVLITVFLLFLR
ncbi:MAG: NADH-quinone oxidoreductase subunit L [Acetobacteraceae bacterium]|nr:NADH-quinone oxidoreductase subunit L [Acetobacteraceae bacterium]